MSISIVFLLNFVEFIGGSEELAVLSVQLHCLCAGTLLNRCADYRSCDLVNGHRDGLSSCKRFTVFMLVMLTFRLIAECAVLCDLTLRCFPSSF